MYGGWSQITYVQLFSKLRYAGLEDWHISWSTYLVLRLKDETCADLKGIL